ncbi:hypothetical protein TNCV_2851701 [Trichonephila clavipes]|nr:hypothetical protein TNCV_2851701 [Trichonephila clavipes]
MGYLTSVEECLNAQVYLSIIADEEHSFILIKYPARGEYFLLDNGLFSTANIVPKWFQEHDRSFTLLSWPAHSPDFNPVENHWDEIKLDI